MWGIQDFRNLFPPQVLFQKNAVGRPEQDVRQKLHLSDVGFVPIQNLLCVWGVL